MFGNTKTYVYVCYEIIRSMSKFNKPTESELEVLQILWSNGASTVRQVNDQLNEQREVGYTTTLKIMQIMAEKGLVIRDTSSRTHVYKAKEEEGSAKNHILKDFIKSTFSGSATELILQALGSSKPTQSELEEIRSLIDKLQNED